MPTSSRYPRHIELTRKLMVGLPIVVGAPILALTGVFGPARVGIVARVTFVYLFVLACFRILGKRELSQMAPFEIVTLFFVPQLFKNAITRDDNSLATAVVGALTLFSLVVVTSVLRYRSARVERLVQATPSVLVHDGELAHETLAQERVTADDVLSAMRKVGLEHFAQVKWAMLEADGKISIVPVEEGVAARHDGVSD